MDKVKWAQLIKYLDTTDAKPEKVLNLVKQSFKPKGKKITKDDDFNQVRRAWAMYVVLGIYNKFGTPTKDKRKQNITNTILYFVESQAYKTNYNLMHPVKTYNENLKYYVWKTAEENLYKKKLYHSTVRTAENYGIVQKEKNLENTSKELKVRFQYFTRDN